MLPAQSFFTSASKVPEIDALERNAPEPVILQEAEMHTFFSPEEWRQFVKIIQQLLSRNLPAFLVLIYALDYLSNSKSNARLYVSVNLLQILLGSINRKIISIGIANNKKIDPSRVSYTDKQIMNSSVHIALTIGLTLVVLGNLLAGLVVPKIVPGADAAEIRLAMHLYTSVIPLSVSLSTVGNTVLINSAKDLELRLGGRDALSGSIAILLYFFLYKPYTNQAFIYTILTHAMTGIALTPLILGEEAHINFRHFYQDFKNKMRIAYETLGLGFLEGLQGILETFGWMVFSWMVSQKVDPRSLSNEAAQVIFTAGILDTLPIFFRKKPPTTKLMLCLNSIALVCGMSLGSLLSWLKGASPLPGLITPVIGLASVRNMLKQKAMDKALNPQVTNNKMVNRHSWVTSAAILILFLGYLLGNLSAENAFWLYPLLTWGISALISAFYLVKPVPAGAEERKQPSALVIASMFSGRTAVFTHREAGLELEQMGAPKVEIDVDPEEYSTRIAGQ